MTKARRLIKNNTDSFNYKDPLYVMKELGIEPHPEPLPVIPDDISINSDQKE